MLCFYPVQVRGIFLPDIVPCGCC